MALAFERLEGQQPLGSSVEVHALAASWSKRISLLFHIRCREPRPGYSQTLRFTWHMSVVNVPSRKVDEMWSDAKEARAP